jgi:hypothetical protein
MYSLHTFIVFLLHVAMLHSPSSGRTFLLFTYNHKGTAVAQWLRYCATNQKVAGSIPEGVTEFFIDINSSDRTMALGSTQHLTEMSTRNISWGKGGRCVRLTTLPLTCAVVKKSGNLNFLEPSGLLQACNGTDLLLSYNHKLLKPNAVIRFNKTCNTVQQDLNTVQQDL